MSILPPQDLLTLRHTDLVSNIETKMDSMKSATGLSTDPSQKSGEEPLSGEKGQGTVDEPYDQGNAEGEFVFRAVWWIGLELADCADWDGWLRRK